MVKAQSRKDSISKKKFTMHELKLIRELIWSKNTHEKLKRERVRNLKLLATVHVMMGIKP